MWRKGTLVDFQQEFKLVQPLFKTVQRFLKNLKIELPHDPAIPLLDIYLQKKKTQIQKDTCTPVVIAALFTITNIWVQPQCPSIDEQVKNMWCIYTMEYYSAIKRNEILQFVTTWMDLEGTMLIGMNQTKTNTV